MKTRMLMGLAGAALAAALVAGCGGKNYVKGGKVEDTLSQKPDEGSYIEAIGIGAADPSLPSETQRRALSRDAAIVKAQYEMLSMVKGVDLEGGVKVEQAMETDSTLEAKLKETIKGAEIMKTEYTKDDGAVVTLRLKKSRLEQMMGVKFK
ncbi:MAG: hypothetical protein KGL53_05200 [Elusimicrobia bacterium]|nr:hypothetical protein [Elusimicrobiota bacterium]